MGDTPHKYSFGGKSIYQQDGVLPIIHFAKVTSVTDDFDGNRVRARIKGIDDLL